MQQEKGRILKSKLSPLRVNSKIIGIQKNISAVQHEYADLDAQTNIINSIECSYADLGLSNVSVFCAIRALYTTIACVYIYTRNPQCSNAAIDCKNIQYSIDYSDAYRRKCRSVYECLVCSVWFEYLSVFFCIFIAYTQLPVYYQHTLKHPLK